MILAVSKINKGYYFDRLVLKGGLSVRNHVPLIDHRFSFDADYNVNTSAGYSFRDVEDLRSDLLDYASVNRCSTPVDITMNNPELLFLEFGYRKTLSEMGCQIIEPPKVELCKRCRMLLDPVRNEMNTFIDLELLGISPPVVYHVALEEQLATKLSIIGSVGRQRNHFDAYDAMRIAETNEINWKLTRKLFETIVERRKKKKAEYVEECRRQLDAMLLNSGKRSNLEETIFQPGYSYDTMITKVKSLYDFKG